MDKIERVSVRLVSDSYINSQTKINTPIDAVRCIQEYLDGIDREVVAVINISSSGKPVNVSVVSVGTLNEAMFHPREIFKTAILSNAASMIVIHTHPSGCLNPSRYDVEATNKLLNASIIVGIPILDHIIIGSGTRDYYSFKEKDILKEDIDYIKEYDFIEAAEMAVDEDYEYER